MCSGYQLSPPKTALLFIVRAVGAIPIDYRKEDFVERIRESTGEGMDAVFDAIGDHNFKRSFGCLKKSGTLIAYGFYNAGTGKGGNVIIDFIRLFLWNILPNGRAAKFYGIKHDKRFSTDLAALFSMLAEGKIKPLIEKRMKLEEAKEAHELFDKAAVKGKIILMVHDK